MSSGDTLSTLGLTMSILCFFQGHPKGRCLCSYMAGVYVVCSSFFWVRLDPKLERMPAQTVVDPLTLFSPLVLMVSCPDGERAGLLLFSALVP